MNIINPTNGFACVLRLSFNEDSDPMREFLKELPQREISNSTKTVGTGGKYTIWVGLEQMFKSLWTKKLKHDTLVPRTPACFPTDQHAFGHHRHRVIN